MRTVDALAVRVGAALGRRAARLAIAESCTGGLVGGRLTAIPGSSRYLLGGVVAYHNSVKSGLLRVPPALLARNGAVSAPVAAAMARGARRVFKADIAVAVTGIAGPGGGSTEKPVGLVFVAVCGFGTARCRRILLDGDRQQVRAQAVDLALVLLLEHLEEGPRMAVLRRLPAPGSVTRGTRGRSADPGGVRGARRVVPRGFEL